MPIFPSLPDESELADVLRAFPVGLEPLLAYHDALLRGESPLSIAERELIATYVSGLNQCSFCHDAHRAYAEANGLDPDLFEALVDDPAKAGVDEKLLPILAYVKTLTHNPSRVTEKGAAAVYEAGWSEEALFHAVAVCALFNFMNRIVDGSGVVADPLMRAASRERIAGDSANPRAYRDFANIVRGRSDEKDRV